MAPFTAIFSGALLVNIVATFRSSSYWDKYCGQKQQKNDDQSNPLLSVSGGDENSQQLLSEKHSALLKKYLAVYLLAAISDWLQGPYVYALYDAYGYSQHDIAILFVAGFFSSMSFGTCVGSMADACGRRKMTILFTVIYALSCITKHFKDFKVLMLGRLLGGVATSLLFSVFDSWLIRAHADAGLTSYLSKSFAAAQYGNSIVAIMAGLFANKVASSEGMVPLHGETDNAVVYMGGYLNPFDAALIVLVICGLLASMTWDENYGTKDSAESDESDSAKKSHWYDAFTSAFTTTMRNKEILFVGLICSLFEGSMYVFVFMWTPAMTKLSGEDSLPFGLIFATFMVCCMAGSSIFSILIKTIKVEQLAIYVFCVATFAFSLMAFSTSETAVFLCFLLFETSVGVYFPCMGTMKSHIVPESKRSAIYNLFRIPLNMIVLFSLMTDLTPQQSFKLGTLMLGTATFLQTRLVNHQKTFFSTVSGGGEDLEMAEEPVTPTKSAPSPLNQEAECCSSGADSDKCE